MKKWQWILGKFSNKLWLRASIFSLIGLLAALAGSLLNQYIPEEVSRTIDAEAVEDVLHILANSMLVVTTFSLSTMVAAYGAATSNATPRSTRLLLDDKTSQNALSTFIGAFLYSIVGIIALDSNAYGNDGRLILFGITLLVVAYIILTLLRWIDHLSKLGRMDHTIALVEKATTDAIAKHIEHPYLKCQPLKEYRPAITHKPIISTGIGYVEHIDLEALSAIAEEANIEIYLQSLPGRFASQLNPLAYVSNPLIQQDIEDAIKDAFVIGEQRSFQQDARFGLIVLGEIASRALSPAVNDPGTAISIINSAVRVLSPWLEKIADAPKELVHKRIHAPTIVVADILEDIFQPIARDGAGHLEVGIRLQKGLKALKITVEKSNNNPDVLESLKIQSSFALSYANRKLVLDEEKAILKKYI